VVGDSCVGKTAIVKRLTLNEFFASIEPTVGVEFGRYRSGNVRLKIWDTAGQERFRPISKAYFRNSVAALLVFSIDNRASFEAIDRWLDDVKALASQNVVLFLVGNRSDAETVRTVTEDEAREYARRHDMEYVETSAKTGSGIQEVFEQLARRVGEIATTGVRQAQ
jgi:Ras-related protein Rab-39A/Ras-related protein Rab-39B